MYLFVGIFIKQALSQVSVFFIFFHIICKLDYGRILYGNYN